jgi:hypothetical protein
MQRPDWAPAGIDTDRPSTARIYDYLLGGSHNFAVDRELAQRGIAEMPELPALAHANRAFLLRAVRVLLDAGVRQFLDVGSGIPTRGNVHEVAQRVNPDARVMYVDIDPVAVAHSQAILAGNDRAGVISGDLRRPEAILDHPDLRALLDLDQPVALLLLAVLHFIPDTEDPGGITARLRDRLAPGSYLTISHWTVDGRPQEWERARELSKQVPVPPTPRTRAEVERLFAGFDLIEPGVVWVTQWRPDRHPNFAGELDEHPERSGNYAGLGRKP